MGSYCFKNNVQILSPRGKTLHIASTISCGDVIGEAPISKDW